MSRKSRAHGKIDRERWLEAVGAAIRQFRVDAGLSQEELGSRAGLHRTYVSDAERGQRNPTVVTLLSLAGALATTPSGILQVAEDIFGS